MPSYFIYLTVDPERVDVNVHPQKTTVKFADNDVILEILQAAVRETLAKTGAVPMMDFSDEGRLNIPVLEREQRVFEMPKTHTNQSYNPFAAEYIDPTAPMPDVPFTGFDVPYEEPKASGRVTPSRPSVVEECEEVYTLQSSSFVPSTIEYIDEEEVAQEQEFDFIESESKVEVRSFGEAMALPGGYAVAMYGESLVVVHLRRAKERILYDDIFASLVAGAAPSQRMFFPEELTLSIEEYQLMESHATEFAALGFEVEYQGEGRISVMGRPAMVDMSMPLDELIYDLLQGIEDGRLPLEEEQSRLAEVMARRGSQNYGRGLRTADVEVLLKRLETCKNTNFSPSGAPIMAEITMAELQARLMKNYS